MVQGISLYYAVKIFTCFALVLFVLFLPEFRLSFLLLALQGVFHILLLFWRKCFLKAVFRLAVLVNIALHKGYR